jgi:hypothetical protein
MQEPEKLLVKRYFELQDKYDALLKEHMELKQKYDALSQPSFLERDPKEKIQLIRREGNIW